YVALLSTPVFSQKMKAEDVVAKHLDSIGSAEVRSKNTSRIIVGDAAVTFISPKNLPANGRIVLASAGQKNFWGLNLNAVDYPFEKFSYDGKKVKVAYVRTGQRSLLGNFVLTYDLLMENSLLGGTLSTSWILLNQTEKKLKLSFEGTKKIDGKEVYVLDYSPKSDINVQFYFNKETFRHVRTQYSRIFSAAAGRTPDTSSQQNESRLKVIENFSDFKEESGLTLPHNYNLQYSISGARGGTDIEWNFTLNEFLFNQTLQENTFDAEVN
ncbi:MAG TPA: hypothetical protein VGP58_08745, partial [Pyrinomonadaceae bacterium]|nr:hypothetical protein [Pyrinomonadaceae bacterium]